MTVKTNICFFLGSFQGGGAENMVLQILRHIDKNKFAPFVCVFTKEGILKDEYESLGINIYEFPVNNIIRAAFEYIRFVKFLFNYKITVIHINLVGTFLFSMTAAFLTGIKIRILHWQNAYEYSRTKKRKAVKYGSLLATKIIAISEYVKKRNCDIYEIESSKVVTIYNSIEINETKENVTKNKEMVVGTIGKMTEQKGYDVLLKSFSLVAKQYPECRLEIIGNGKLKNEIKKMIEDYELKNNVELLGVMPNYVAKERMKTWKIFVLASRWEGFGIVLIEAMSLGIPVVASSVEAIPEIVKDGKCGYLFQKDNFLELAEKLNLMIGNTDEISNLGKAGRSIVLEKFNIIRTIKSFESLYNQK
ncbi:MAG: glycosyltransferase family 4 protein [Candidatus Hodarchaeota archaeon]